MTLLLLLRNGFGKKCKVRRGSLLSRAGKEVLIKVVAQSIPTYSMGVFQLPGKLCDELDTMCANWGGEENTLEKFEFFNTIKERGWNGFQRFTII